MIRILKAGAPSHPSGLPDDIYASAFRTSSIAIVVSAVVTAFQDHYDAIMRGTFRSELVKECSAADLVKNLKRLGREKVYCTKSNLKLELMGRRVICELMDDFWEAARDLPIDSEPETRTFPGKAGALLSENYRRVFRNSVKQMPRFPELYHRFQLLTDYVCGMTDSFAKRLHAELRNG